MGLDLYMTEKRHFGGFNAKEVKAQIEVVNDNDPNETHELVANDYGMTVERTVIYWRKANQIYKWFIDNCMKEYENDTRISVSIEDLKELLETCKKVAKSISFATDQVECGTRLSTVEGGKKVFLISLITDEKNRVVDIVKNGTSTIKALKKGDLFIVEGEKNGWNELKEIEKRDDRYSIHTTMWEIGKIVDNPSVAQKLLPTQNGFFFGSTDYTEWYAEQINDTIKDLEKVIADYDDFIAKGGRAYDIEFEVLASY